MSDLNNFIKNELQKRKADYCSSPAYILEHYNIEKQNIEAYNGRQLLEMLQNADDASENAIEKKVLIRLNDNYLTIANNGESFNEDGLRSIIYSNLSSKTLQQNKIGQKGLGFRSILSWADEVIINSGETQLAFSEKIAKSFLETLLIESKDISTFLEQKSKLKLPIAILRVPELLNNVTGPVNSFDTTISIKLKENIIDDVQSQIFSIINKETLIFLNHIEIIEIDSPKRKIIYKKSYSDKSKKQVYVESEDLLEEITETKTWQMKRKNGVHKEKNYELAIAWNSELNETENVLFSYFKTEVRFPFPALLHGTFELTQDRNQLVNDTDGHNEYLTGELSELLIETALEISENTGVNYLPLKILNIEFDKVDNVLQKFNFKETLIEKIKSSNVFPSVNKSYNTYKDKPVFYDLPVASFVNGDDVKSLMPICTDKAVIEYLKTLNTYHYTFKGFISIISKRAITVEVSVLAKLIYFLLEYGKYKDELNSNSLDLLTFSEFLLDSENNIINWNSNIFIQPENIREFKLPKSLNIRFLNKNLVNALLQEYKTENTEILLSKLKPFGVKKYSFSEITETLIQHFQSKAKIEIKDVIELHVFLFGLFKNELTTIEPSPLSYQIDTPVISGNKEIRKANNVYFGKYYGNSLAEKLYKYDKSKLLAPPIKYGLEGESDNDLKKYFKWLGIAELPRKITASAPQEFAEYTFKKYNYKNNVSDHHFTDYENFKSSRNRYGEIIIQYIDELDAIIKNNNCETIIAWLCADDSIYKLLETDCEPSESSIKTLFLNDRYYRVIKGKLIPNFLKWKLSNSTWISTKSGIKQAPLLCTTSATISEEFSPLIEKPNIDYDAPILKLNKINPDKVDYLLNIVGVNKTISSFETKTLYSILNKLPEIDQDGKKAKTLYRELAVNYEEKNLDTSESEYKHFILEGKVFCNRHGELSYENIDSVFYVGNKRYGESIINQFHTIEIERRRSQEKIEKIFGVKPLKKLKLTLANSPN
ncbi:MAG: sacsin N-terminal ATP-binding-like domain-containing protein, partial [Bacteroidia bacterium]